jgi:hypothetical protein
MEKQVPGSIPGLGFLTRSYSAILSFNTGQEKESSGTIQINPIKKYRRKYKPKNSLETGQYDGGCFRIQYGGSGKRPKQRRQQTQGEEKTYPSACPFYSCRGGLIPKSPPFGGGALGRLKSIKPPSATTL